MFSFHHLPHCSCYAITSHSIPFSPHICYIIQYTSARRIIQCKTRSCFPHTKKASPRRSFSPGRQALLSSICYLQSQSQSLSLSQQLSQSLSQPQPQFRLLRLLQQLSDVHAVPQPQPVFQAVSVSQSKSHPHPQLRLLFHPVKSQFLHSILTALSSQFQFAIKKSPFMS